MKLITIPENKFNDYKLDLIFECYKWDPQFLDNNTISKHILIISKDEDEELKKLTEQLDKETIKAERYINNNLKLAKPLELSKKISKELIRMKNYQPNNHIRLTRYDFHPIEENKWAISEVNSDVPGGFAESSLMPKLANKLLKDKYTYKDFSKQLINAFKENVKQNGTIMLVHCTSYSDDRQVMQFLGDKLTEEGFKVIYGAADHIEFKNKEAYSILSGNQCKIDAIFRFTPLEWLIEMKTKNWKGYFDTITLSCNHPISIFAQTKRFPLIWPNLEKEGIILSTWKNLLPNTIEIKDARNKEGYIYKPACGRVGEKISIKEACTNDEYLQIMKDVKKHPKQFIAQKQFSSKPLITKEGEKFHICIGSYIVNGKHSGYYARISKTNRIDSYAADIPVLIERN